MPSESGKIIESIYSLRKTNLVELGQEAASTYKKLYRYRCHLKTKRLYNLMKIKVKS